MGRLWAGGGVREEVMGRWWVGGGGYNMYTGLVTSFHFINLLTNRIAGGGTQRAPFS